MAYKIDHALPRAGRTPARNILRIQKGLKGATKNAVTYRSCLELFITDAMVEEICTCTNDVIEQYKVYYSNKDLTQIRNTCIDLVC